jgi:hypothetical protein
MHGGVASARRDPVTNPAAEGGSGMPSARADTGRDAKT